MEDLLICRTWARRATTGASELCHRDHLAWTWANQVEQLRNGPVVWVVVSCAGVVEVQLVGGQVGQRQDGVRVWLELGGQVGYGEGRVFEGASSCCRTSIKAGPTVRLVGRGTAVSSVEQPG